VSPDSIREEPPLVPAVYCLARISKCPMVIEKTHPVFLIQFTCGHKPARDPLQACGFTKAETQRRPEWKSESSFPDLDGN
jgi:hypothetical protein